jgi:hypothetical protein
LLRSIKKDNTSSTRKELQEALRGDSTKLKYFFSAMLNDDTNREEFEANLKKFVTGSYNNFEEFQRNVKETMGISADRLAIETQMLICKKNA